MSTAALAEERRLGRTILVPAKLVGTAPRLGLNAARLVLGAN